MCRGTYREGASSIERFSHRSSGSTSRSLGKGRCWVVDMTKDTARLLKLLTEVQNRRLDENVRV